MAEHAVEAEGLTKRFGDEVALDGVDLAVPPGTVLGLLGPNGAGKTTTVRILATVLRPDAGRARVLGVDVVAHPERVRPLLGMAGQYAAVDENLTGRENLRLVARLTHLPRRPGRERADELLERFALSDAADRPAKTWSGGMRRRLDLAAALVHRPPVLVLDEPTTGLDPRSRNDLWDVLGELVAGGTTLLLTTQYLEEADRLADRIVVVDRGRVIAEGTAADLKARVGRTEVEVTVRDPRAAGRASEALAPIGPVAPTPEGHGVTVQVGDRGPSVLAVARALDAAGVVPEAVAVREPTLDSVFLQLTGRPAGPATGAAASGEPEPGDLDGEEAA
jgi:ABC-2 type transport system ATP-binding protein